MPKIRRAVDPERLAVTHTVSAVYACFQHLKSRHQVRVVPLDADTQLAPTGADSMELAC